MPVPITKWTYLIVGVALFLTLPGCVKQPAYWVNKRSTQYQEDLDALYNRADVPNHPLTLDEVVEIAKKRNLDLLVKCQEYRIQHEAATNEMLKMIPSLAFTNEWTGRDRNTGSASESLVPGIPPAPPSISSEQSIQRWDLTFTWRLLDFGITYYRSRQELDRIIMQKLEYQRLEQNLILDVVRQYWKAVVAKEAINQAEVVVARASEHIEILEKQIAARIIPKIRGLKSENELINIQLELHGYYKDYHAAMGELALLMGMPPCLQFEIETEVFDPVDISGVDIRHLEELALQYRPELYSFDVEERVMADEARIAMVQMFPGVDLFAGWFQDENRFLIFNWWRQMGLRTLWDLLRLPQHYQNAKCLAAARKDLIKKNRLALSIGVLTQINLAYLVYQDNLKQLKLAQELADVNKRLLNVAYEELKRGVMHERVLMEYLTQALLAEIGAYQAYGELQHTLAQLSNTIGIPFYFRDFPKEKGLLPGGSKEEIVKVSQSRALKLDEEEALTEDETEEDDPDDLEDDNEGWGPLEKILPKGYIEPQLYPEDVFYEEETLKTPWDKRDDRPLFEQEKDQLLDDRVRESMGF